MASVKALHPVDKGWSWVVMMGCLGVHVISIGYMRSFGILLREFQDSLGSSSAAVAAISGAQYACYSSGTFLAMHVLIRRVSVRTCCLVGCCMQVIAVASSAFVDNIYYLVLTQGIIYGCGHALLHCPSLYILSQYFDRRRPIATALATSGASVGGFLFPLLTRYLLDHFGLCGALLLLSSVMMQQLAIVMFYTPPGDYIIDNTPSRETESCMKQDYDKMEHIQNEDDKDNYKEYTANHQSNKQNGDFNQRNLTSHDTNDFSIKVKANNIINQRNFSKSSGHLSCEVPNNNKLKQGSSYSLHKRKNSYSRSQELIQTLCFISSENLQGSVPLLQDAHCKKHHACLYDELKLQDVESESCKNISISEEDITKTCQVSSDCTERQPNRCWSPPPLLFRPLFWLLASFLTLAYLPAVLPFVYLPSLAAEKGLSKGDSAFMLTLSAAADIFGRLTPGVILHFTTLQPSSLLLVPALTLGAMFFITPLIQGYVSMAAMAVAMGALTSSYWTLQSLLIIEVLGLEHLASAMAFYAVFQGMTAGLAFPVSGSLVDVTGTYTSVYLLTGGAYVIAAMFLLAVKVKSRS